MNEFDRLVNEMRATQTAADAHSVLRLSLMANLNQRQRKQLLAAWPPQLRAAAHEPQSVLATIQSLQALNVHRGLATKWSYSTPWRDNPWRLIQVSAGRAIMTLLDAVAAPVRLQLKDMARAIAVADTPEKGWQAACVVADTDTPQAGLVARALAGRCFLAAWTTMVRIDEKPAQVMQGWLKAVLPLTGSSDPLEVAGLTAQAVAAALLNPEQALVKLDWRASGLWPALPEVLASVSVYEHVRRPDEAEDWLNHILTK